MSDIIKMSTGGEILADNQYLCQLVYQDQEVQRAYMARATDDLSKNMARGAGYIVKGESPEQAAITFASYIMERNAEEEQVLVRVNNMKLNVSRAYTTQLLMG